MDPSRHRVDAVTDGIEVGLAVDGEVRALGDLAAKKAVEGLVRGPLEAVVRLGEEDLDPRLYRQLCVARHLSSLVEGEGAPSWPGTRSRSPVRHSSTLVAS
jgi:hypothetical protein